MMNLMRRALVIGGSGALGRSMVEIFRDSWEVTSVDLRENSSAHKNIILNELQKIDDQCESCKRELTGKYDAILCVAGGFAGGSISEPEVFSKIQHLMKLNLFPCVMAGHIATQFLAEEGLIVLTGAAACFKDTTPGIIAYALSKTATHSLALNLATRQDIPATSTVATILPEVIDTPSNRDAMPNADFSKWANPRSIAALVKMWAEGVNRPENGSFAVLKTVNGQIVPEFV
ncbi:unnamed protein product [Blepharisma stoltei]|uniref:Dihydropteridine reductase n=1 Tax=Blepharisma stoltei TaxID=1481888 RepID=A0AAU9JPA4_9CILI|nr:unnamed protein product [Blepharisma stoltei]